MSHQDQVKYDQIRAALGQLHQDAGYESKVLLQWVETAEEQALQLERLEAIEAENDRLKQEVKRLRDLYYSKTASSMSTKLKEALRE